MSDRKIWDLGLQDDWNCGCGYHVIRSGMCSKCVFGCGGSKIKVVVSLSGVGRQLSVELTNVR